MLKILSCCSLVVLSINIPTLAMHTPDVEPSKVKVTLHIINENFGPSEDTTHPNYFDQCQQLAEQEISKSQYGCNFHKETFFSVGRYAEEYSTLSPVPSKYGLFYRYDKPLHVVFSVQMTKNDEVLTTGVKKPYDIKTSRGKYIDISIPLSLEQWKNVFRFQIDLLGHSYGKPDTATGYIREKCIDSISKSFNSFYVSHSGDTTEYHIFQDVVFSGYDILNSVVDPQFNYRDFKKQRSDSLNYKYLTEKQ